MSIGNFEAFMAAVRQRESSDNYGIMNNFGFAGAYQLGELAMIDAGFYEKDGTSKNDWTGEWTQKAKDMGVNSINDFLSNTAAQDMAAQAYWQKAWSYIRAAGLDKYVGQTINGVIVTESALIGAYHLVGLGYTDKKGIRHPGLKDYLTSGGSIDPTDANKTKVSEYMNLFNDYEVPFEKGVGSKSRPKRESSSTDAMDSANQFFTAANNAFSPITLDLDRDGVETTHVKDGAYFDHDGNGFAEQTGWAGADDGILVMDRNSNGRIDDGKELFGNETLLAGGTKAANGFQALAELDTNLDGKIDANDTAFSQLRVWQDIDGDGYSTADELKGLSELGIQAINTGYANSTIIDAQGNEHRQIGSFTWSDGTTSAAEDVWFQRDTMYTIAAEWLDVPADIAALPDLQGYGNVYDLHQAMVRDTSGQLKSLVEQFMTAADPAARTSLMEQILFRWTGSDTVDPASRGGVIDARKLVSMERLFGEQFLQLGVAPNPAIIAVELLERAYDGLFETFYSQLMAQTHLKDLYDMITYTWDETAQTVRGDLSAVRAEIQSQLDADYNHGRQLLTEFSRTVQGFQAADMLNFTAFGNAFVTRNEELAWAIDSAGKKIATGTAGSDTISGGSRAEAFAGGESNDTLRGSEGDDALYGGNGDDTLDGGIGADVLHGGKGNDLLNGGVNNDTYRFWLGGGVDTINDYDNTVGNSDTVEFGEGIMSADVELLKEGSDLRINIRGTTDSLIIQSWFSGNSYKIEQFKFADGTVLTVTDLNAIGYKVYGTALNDIPLQGSNGRDEMYGYDGNDTLRGNEGDDVLYGGNGDDTLDGGYGNDVLDGGAGNDSLQSGYGNDTYRFALGSGTDTISDYDTTVGNADTVEFGQGITRSDLEMIKEGNDLRIAVKGSMDTLILQNWFLGPAYRVEEFRFADGTVVSAGDLGISIPFVIRGTAGNDNMSGTIWRDELYGKEGNDVLWALSGDDVLDGGAGNDLLYGDKGNDTYRFGLGGGVDTINDYDNTMGNSDTVEFGEGVSSADVEFAKEGMDLRITIKGTADALKVANWFSNDGRSYYIERFVFHDGTAISAGDLGTSIPFMIRGTTTADTLVGTNLRDELYGGEGNDTLNGGGGADVLDGGIGNDSLLGGAGNDIYRFNLGYGMDTISEYDTAAGNIDTVEFGSGIVQSDLELFKEGDSLRINIKGTTDSLVIQYWFVSDGYKVEQFKFADGSVLTPAGLDAIGYKVYGTAGNDTSLQGSNANDEMLGYAGNDYIYGNQGNDVLDGGAGVDYLNGGQGNDILNGGADNDTLYGESGSDILDGGTGNDYLSGSLGNDTYKFALGSGIDTIYDYDTTVGNTDTVAISANPLDLIFARNGSNLDITINSTTDRITVQNWYSTTGYQTEVFHTADGDNLLNTQVDQLIQAMATFCTNNGISSWSQAIQDRPQDVQQVLAQYWTPQMP